MEYDYYSSTPPKLSIFSDLQISNNRSQQDHRSLTLTPPSASIPFKWEEAPGKPRQGSNKKPTAANNSVARCLELPPRLSKMPSPTTVLDGPCPSDLTCRSLSYRKFGGGSFRILPEISCKSRAGFGSGRWGSSSTSVTKLDNKEDGRGSFDFAVFPAGDDINTGGDGVNVKIVKMRRRASFLRFSTAKPSHVMANVYKSIKQVVVPWRRH